MLVTKSLYSESFHTLTGVIRSAKSVVSIFAGSFVKGSAVISFDAGKDELTPHSLW